MKKVCVQGLGFVGAAMAVAVASTGEYKVTGIERDDPQGRFRAEKLKNGELPFETLDDDLVTATRNVHLEGNLETTTSPGAFSSADIILISVGLDVDKSGDRPSFDPSHFKSAIGDVADNMPPDALVIIETTVPPGTTDGIALPVIQERLSARGVPSNQFMLAHSYERVMPGKGYFRSIRHFWRVYAGMDDRAADACRDFFEIVIDTENFPLTRVKTCRASELAKVLENTYRATTIALMDEWGRLAERIGVDLFEVIDAIRFRPTHNNMREPGFGVGGYCLTKDPLFAEASARQLFGADDLDFPMSNLAVKINDRMPERYADWVAEALGGLAGKRVLLCGIAYRPGVADTRYSASEIFARKVIAGGGVIVAQDPLMEGPWREMNLAVQNDMGNAAEFDAVVFAVGHDEYKSLDMAAWLNDSTPFIIDANHVLTAAQLEQLDKLGASVRVAGRGDI
jgi:UDP-N-acetyl-D-glucosamine dehydrogenase